MNIRYVQLDGSLPNLALMRLAHHHRYNGDYVYRSQSIASQPNEPKWDRVYGSAIFKFSTTAVDQFIRCWPNGILGGTGTTSLTTVEQIVGEPWEFLDYTDYPDYKDSIGFTQRGCRLSCKFCVVPQKEGKPKSVNTIWEIWRGDPYPRKLHLLDNDFFGQPEWRERIQEIIDGKFRVCLAQGINVRMINEESAKALASIQYRDTRFQERKLYTAWDNLRDEKVFFTGVELLGKYGVPPKHLRSYMLVGYDILETWERIWHRFLRMVNMGIEPYPMVYDRSRTDLICFQRWACRGLYRIIPWPDYVRRTKSEESVRAWHAYRATAA